jgi:hypothetical protein
MQAIRSDFAARSGTNDNHVKCFAHVLSHGRRNELSVGLKWLDMPVPYARVLLTRGEIARCESRCSRHSPAHAPRPP